MPHSSFNELMLLPVFAIFLMRVSHPTQWKFSFGGNGHCAPPTSNRSRERFQRLRSHKTRYKRNTSTYNLQCFKNWLKKLTTILKAGHIIRQWIHRHDDRVVRKVTCEMVGLATCFSSHAFRGTIMVQSILQPVERKSNHYFKLPCRITRNISSRSKKTWLGFSQVAYSDERCSY